MDWSTIITTIIAAIAGGGVVQLLTIRQERRKGNAEAHNTEVDASQKQNDEWQEIVAEYKEQAKQVNELRAEINILHEKVNRLYTANAVALRFYCENKNCKKRCPPFGTATDQHLQERSESEKKAIIKKQTFKKNEKHDEDTH